MVSVFSNILNVFVFKLFDIRTLYEIYIIEWYSIAYILVRTLSVSSRKVEYVPNKNIIHKEYYT